MWPMPRANCGNGIGRGPNLGGANLQTECGGPLNPTWVEWLMGYPPGWTVLKDWATRSSRKSRKSSGAQS
jgi:DNA (cytosine-5)-methyltransferase 1